MVIWSSYSPTNTGPGAHAHSNPQNVSVVNALVNSHLSFTVRKVSNRIEHLSKGF